MGSDTKQAKEKGMSEDELVNMCRQEWNNSELFNQEIQEERQDALDFYHTEKFGNEEEGLSKYVSSDVRDVVDWQIAQLVEVFYGGDAPVKFNPDNAEDVRQAEIETKYCQYVFERQNNGFEICYNWFKTALIQKNGITKVYWDDAVKEEQEEYRNQDYHGYTTINDDEDFEVKTLTITLDETEYTEDEFETYVVSLATDEETEYAITNARADVDGVRKSTVSQIRIDVIPPEEFNVSRNHNSLDLKDCGYHCHRYTKTKGELIDDGYKEDMIKSLPSGDENEYDDEKVNRFKKEGGAFTEGDASFDWTRQEVTVYEHYISTDYKGTGKSQLRMVREVGHSGDYVLDNDAIDRSPFHSICPYPSSFKFYGRSQADNVESIQRINSQVMRNILDNVMYQSQPRKIITGNVDIDDLLTFVPNGIIRKDKDATIESEIIPSIAQTAFPVLEKMDGIRAERSGFSRQSMGLDPKALANSTNLVGSMVLSQSQLLVKLIARLFAETGFKSMMLHVRELMIKHETKEKIFELAGDYVETDPRAWRKLRSSEITVGLGFASKQEELAYLKEVLDTQKEIIAQQGGLDGALLSADNVYNALTRYAEKAGVKDHVKYFRDPKTYKAPPPQPSQGDIQLQLTNKQLEQQAVKDEQSAEIEAEKLTIDTVEKERDRDLQLKMHNDKINSAEKMHEQELIYKYGELAHKKNQEILSNLKGERNHADIHKETKGE